MFDFGSPNAFLSHEAIPAIEKRTGVKFGYVPILLGGIFKATNNKSPAESLAGIKNKREFDALETDILPGSVYDHGVRRSGHRGTHGNDLAVLHEDRAIPDERARGREDVHVANHRWP